MNKRSKQVQRLTLIVLLLAMLGESARAVSSEIRFLDFHDIEMKASGKDNLFVSSEHTFEIPESAISFKIQLLASEGGKPLIRELISPSGRKILSERFTKLPSDQTETWYAQAESSDNPMARPTGRQNAILVPNTPGVIIEPGVWKFSALCHSQVGPEPCRRLDASVVIKEFPFEIDNRTTGRLNVHLHFSGARGWRAETAASDESFQDVWSELVQPFKQIGIELVAKTFNDIPLATYDRQAMRDILFTKGLKDGINLYFMRSRGVDERGFVAPFGEATSIPGPMVRGNAWGGGVWIAVEMALQGEDELNILRESGSQYDFAPIGREADNPYLFSLPDFLRHADTAAHEIGHYLGLFHTGNFCGSPHAWSDPLPDTQCGDKNNLMTQGAPRHGRIFTLDQRKVMLGHPLVELVNP